MNNLLNFEEFRKHLRMMESLTFQETIDDVVNEGFFGKWKEKKSTNFVDTVLKEEIEIGQEFESRVKETMEELQKACVELQKKNNEKSDFTKKVEKIITDINNVSFDTLTLLGDKDLDVGGFRRSTIMANIINLGVWFHPIKRRLITKKAYQYFLGLIKQTVRRDLVMLIVNFDQFQNIILQKSTESTENAKGAMDLLKVESDLNGIYQAVLQDKVGDKKLKAINDEYERRKKKYDKNRKTDPTLSLFANMYDNTYKQTADTLKSLMNDDTQKQLDALKNSIQKISQGNAELEVYGELLLSNAEERALKTSTVIHSNFLKMSEVFKLSNQKVLIDLIAESEKKQQEKISKENKKLKELYEIETKEEKLKFIEDEYKKIEGDVDLSSLTFKDIEKLKKEEVKFSFTSKHVENEVEDKFSKFDVISMYLSMDNHSDDLKKCSDDLRFTIDTEDSHKESYLGYTDLLMNTINKTLYINNRDESDCYMDFYRTQSFESIVDILDTFKQGEDERKKQTKLLKYVNDNVSKFDYERLLEKIHEIVDALKLKETKDRDNTMDKIKDHIEYLNKIESDGEISKLQQDLENIDKDIKEFKKEYKKKHGGKETGVRKEPEYIKLLNEYNKLEEIIKSKKSGVKVKSPEVSLKTKLNNEQCEEWRESFKKMKTINEEEEKNKK